MVVQQPYYQFQLVAASPFDNSINKDFLGNDIVGVFPLLFAIIIIAIVASFVIVIIIIIIIIMVGCISIIDHKSLANTSTAQIRCAVCQMCFSNVKIYLIGMFDGLARPT
jgi:hypothetical protein